MKRLYQTEDSPEILDKKERVINAMMARLEELKAEAEKEEQEAREWELAWGEGVGGC